MADDTTADALEADLLRAGVDLLDLYRGRLTFRRVCVLVAHLPAEAALWRALRPDEPLTRSELLLATVERRVTVLWATVSAALGHPVPDGHLAGPLDAFPARATTTARTEPEVGSLREIAAWMRS
ncbi:MAG: hypothetical protein ACRDIC_16750 [bacterium]